MFLSSTDHQIPSNNPSSSSSSFLHLTNSSDELGQSHLSTFSIRDYAFSYRTKNFKKSWPFSSTSLQLCLKNGVIDPLPPIQTPEALSLKKPNITHAETISYKRKSEKALVKTKEGTENGLLASGSKSTIQVAIINKNPKKKIGLIVKPGACMDSSGSKEDHSCLVAPSESMALRTCPICKAFSSASNTTLNAHIDQCLSVDSGKQPISKPNRPKVKPKVKVKLMIDIYAAAKVCTLEDLDKRNGTNWAMISCSSNRVVSDKKLEVSNKGKKRSLLRACVKDDAPGIGPVYINDKGQKLRILSEFKKKTSDPSREQEDASEGKGNKSFRKRHRGKKYYKYHKQVLQSKKLMVRKGNASEIPKSIRGNSEEGRGMERSETPAQGQQMLTKRRLSRNRNQKGIKSGVLRDQPSENGHSLSGDPLVLRGSSHVSTDLSEALSSPLYSQNSWRICRESQVSEKSWASSRRKSISSPSFEANPLRCSLPVDTAFDSEAMGVMKLKKARLDFSEKEDDDEDKGRWESEMTQERELTDYDDWDDNGRTFKVVVSSSPSISGEDDDYERYEESGNNKGDDDMLDKTNDADAEFESMIYEQTCCQAAEQESSFMEVDPIPIPGPPGSFLPSPWDMGICDAIETHGNYSVMTSQVLSSQFDRTVDRNSSESTVSAMSNFAAPPETHSHHSIITIDKSCCCQRKEKAFDDTTFGRPPPHMIQQDLGFKNKSVATVASNTNPVLRLMGKDLMVINQTQTQTPQDESIVKSTTQFLDLSKKQQISPPLHRHYGGNGLSFDTSTSYCNIP